MNKHYHKHHIIPRHMGGTDDPSNIVEVTVEQHAELHKQLWQDLGHEEDRIAWKVLSGQITIEEARRLSVIESNKRRCGEKSPLWGKKRTPEIRQKIAQKLKGKNKTSELQIQTLRRCQERMKTIGHTEETKRKISESKKGQIPWNKGRKKVS